MTCTIVCLSSLPSLAQSPNGTVQPGASLPAHLTNVPGAYIAGYVMDEDGKPVPYANVTLWQDGRLWSTKYVLVPSNNPQMSRIAYTNESGGLSFLKEGGFLFGFAAPGEYTLTADKDGYKSSSVKVHVGEETISPSQLESVPHPFMVNITLSGYRVPTLTPGQRANTGAIIGNIKSRYGYGGGGINVSLWRDEILVRLPDNPQTSFRRDYSGKEVDFVFEHLPPGNYTVMATYYAGGRYDETVSVDVGTGTVTADIMLMHEPPPPLATPAPSGLFVLIVMGSAAFLVFKKNDVG